MRIHPLALTLLVLSPASALAQHEGHGRGSPAEGGDDDQGMKTALGLTMRRIGSGTAWLPDDSPMRAFMTRVYGWTVMVHGNLFAGYDYQASDAGDDKAVSQNWVMAMAGRRFGAGHLMARTMLSLEPLTVGKTGYPLLLQSGEQVDGEPLVDRQHPHDLIMEAALIYEHELTNDIAMQLYGALAGEPALGPVAFRIARRR